MTRYLRYLRFAALGYAAGAFAATVAGVWRDPEAFPDAGWRVFAACLAAATIRFAEGSSHHG